MSIVEAGGWRFSAHVDGPRNGALVLFLHGFPQTRFTWRAEVPAVAAAGFHACAPDQRGYSAGARPPSADDYRVEHLAGDVLAIADALGADRFHLVGHDWGGQVAWVTAALHPHRVRSLAVISRPHPAAFAAAMRSDSRQSVRSGHHQRFLRPEATDELLANDASRLCRIYRDSGVPDDAAAAYLATLARRDALDAALNWYRAAVRSEIKAHEVPAVKAPTLYVWGDHDVTVGRAAAEGTAAMVEAPYRFVELPGVGHFVTDQVPAAFAPLLLEHLQSHPVS